MTGGFTALGVPIDSVGRSGGTEFSPRVLRSLGLVEALGAVDAGDLDVSIRGDERDPATGIVASDDVIATSVTIRGAVGEIVGSGSKPFLIGGCCTELVGALAGARDALGLGPSAWSEAIGGPSVRSDDVAILGYRDLEEAQTYGMRHPDTVPGLTHRSNEAVRAAGVWSTGTKVAGALAATGPFWLHLDVDVLDEAQFPATDYLMPRGLTWGELADLIGPLASHPSLAGASVGCYNPEKDPGERCGRRLVELLGAAVGG